MQNGVMDDIKVERFLRQSVSEMPFHSHLITHVVINDQNALTVQLFVNCRCFAVYEPIT